MKLLSNVKSFLFTKEISNNTKTKTIRKYCQNLSEEGYVKVKFYKLFPSEQNKILRDVFKAQGNFLFKSRDHLVRMYDKGKVFKKSLSHIIRELYHYKNASKFPDVCLKSYSFLYILNEICNNYNICEFLKKNDNIIHAQIDGGHFFSFWWYDLINYHDNKNILQNRLFINGIANGDEYYLAINIADLFAKAFMGGPHKFLDYEIQKIEYNFHKLPFSNEIFYQKLWEFLSKNVYKKRILLIGKSELLDLVPIVLHHKNRTKYYEPFKINENITFWFKENTKGYPNENLAVFGEVLKEVDKVNIEICKELKIETISIKDLKKEFKSFFNYIKESTEDYQESEKIKIDDYIREKEAIF